MVADTLLHGVRYVGADDTQEGINREKAFFNQLLSNCQFGE